MNRLHLFRALSPTEEYPASPIDLSFNGIRYDITLPPRVGIAFARLLSLDGPFCRLADYCNPTGFDMLRSSPPLFKPDSKVPAYAVVESQVESTAHGVPVGYIAQQVAANAAAAKQILLSTIDGQTFPLDVVDWICGHASILDYCGGFEIAHVCCYASPDERETALDLAAGAFDDAEPNLYRPHITRLTVRQSSHTKEKQP